MGFRAQLFLTRRRALGAALGAAAFAMLAGPAPAAPAGSKLSPDDIQDLDRVSAYLNSLTAVKGEFSQIAQDGEMSEGVFYMLRPGRMRFDYREPKDAPVLIADGQFFGVEDRKMRSTARYPLEATPLSLLLRKDVDLASDSRVVQVERQPGMLSVTARDSKGLAQGELTLIFRDPGLELLNWIIKDAQGNYTTIAVRDLQEGVSIDPKMFIIKDTSVATGRPK